MATYEVYTDTSSYQFGVGKFELQIKGNDSPLVLTDEDNYTNGSEQTDGKYGGLTKTYYTRYTYYDEVEGNEENNVIESSEGKSESWLITSGIGGDKTIRKTWNGTFDDYFKGLGGHDELYGLGGNDTLIGGDDNDALFGGDDDDSLVGGSGYDLLYSGSLTDGESDTLIGGDDSDTFFLGDSTVEESDVITGEGVDWGNLALSLAGDVSDLAFTIIPGLGTIGKITKEIVPMVFDVAKALSGGEGDTVIAPEEGTTGSATITDFNPIEDVVFIPLPSDGDIYLDQNSNGNNLLKVMHDTTGTDVIATVQLSDDVNTLEGYSSGVLKQDWFSILEKTALIIDTEGAEDYKTGTDLSIDSDDLENLGTNEFLVLGAYGGFEVSGSNESDYMYGTQHNDILAGYEEENTADTANDDVFYGFGGDDEFSGGEGNDRIYGGDGSDTANYSHSSGSIQVDLSTLINGGYVEAQDGHGTTDQLYDIENIVGSDVGDDTITGDDEANIIVGWGGDDTITGYGGDDTLEGGYGEDTIYGGDDNDSIFGGGHTDYLSGGDGDDSIWGAWGYDTLLGGSGNDFLQGGSKDDYINGNLGDDTLTGNANADTFVFDALLGGTDTITDFNGTEGDMIQIDMSVYNVSSLSDLSFDSSTGELYISNVPWAIAILEDPIGFELSSDNISFVD